MDAEEVARQVEIDVLGPARFTGVEVADLADMDVEEAEALWVELGFSPIARDEPRFTDADVEVLRSLRELRESQLIAFDDIAGMTRVLGQALSRVVTAQVQLTASRIDLPEVESLTEGADGTRELERADEIRAAVQLSMEVNERFIIYAWRRHLTEALRRALDPRKTEIIGFADLVGYTRLSRTLDDTELPALVSQFQRTTSTEVSTHGGHILKLIGDGVMFDAPDPESAARAALGIRDELARHDDAPAVRVGLAMGPVVHLEGDVYGDTVNRASRIAELARPNTVLADDAVGSALAGTGKLTVRPLHPRRLRGIGLVRTWSLRHAPAPTE